MELNALSILIGIIGTTSTFALLFWLIGMIRNANRYDRPIYLARDDEVAYAMAMASPRRIWIYDDVTSLVYDNWDLQLLKAYPQIKSNYDTIPRMCDLILTPKKWGGYWASVITKDLGKKHTREMQIYQYITTFLGEYHEDHHISRNREAGTKIVP